MINAYNSGLADGCILENPGWCGDGMLPICTAMQGREEARGSLFWGSVMRPPEPLCRVQSEAKLAVLLLHADSSCKQWSPGLQWYCLLSICRLHL